MCELGKWEQNFPHSLAEGAELLHSESLPVSVNKTWNILKTTPRKDNMKQLGINTVSIYIFVPTDVTLMFSTILKIHDLAV